MKLDLTSYPVTDNHCHPFPAGREPLEFERNFCIGLYPVRSEDMRNTLYYHMMLKELRRLFGMSADVPDKQVIAQRNSMAKEHRTEYTAMLWKDAGYKKFLVDFGYPISQKHDPGKKLSGDEIAEMYRDSADVEIYPVNRIEWVANALIKEKTPFHRFADLFIENTKNMAEREHLIALKSVIAYYTGLEVKILPESEIHAGYERFLQNPQDQNAEKIVRDYCFILGCHVCRELNIPLQVHTGLGDSPDCNLIKGNPFLLYDVLNLPEVRETRLMLIHGSYPYLEELGMILNHYSNVFADLSSLCPYASIAAEDKVLRLMEMAPLNKVCFGTDGGGIPEHSWFGAVYMKRVLAGVLNSLVERGYISYQFAEESAKNILYQNADRIYKIYKK